jgi:hypothetical protein
VARSDSVKRLNILGLQDARFTVHGARTHVILRSLEMLDDSCACFYATHKFIAALCEALVPNFAEKGE